MILSYSSQYVAYAISILYTEDTPDHVYYSEHDFPALVIKDSVSGVLKKMRISNAYG